MSTDLPLVHDEPLVPAATTPKLLPRKMSRRSVFALAGAGTVVLLMVYLWFGISAIRGSAPNETAVMRALVGSEGSTGSVPGTR